jgi:outer membrane protein assembly factor BamC
MQLRNAAALFVSIALGIGMTACSSNKIAIESKKVDYKSEAAKLPPLEIPPDLSRPAGDDRFAVPDVNPKPTATYSDYSRERSSGTVVATAGSNVLPQQDNVRIERDGSQRWLVVKGTPQQVWQTVKDFWQEMGLVVNVEAPESGIMETDWAENRAQINEGIRSWIGKVFENLYSTGLRDKYRTRIEAGTQPGTTEIYISHRGMEEVYTSNGTQGDIRETRWQPRASDPNLEMLMLGKLMTRFGVDDTRAQATVAKGGTTVPPRATLSRGTAGGTLALDDQFDRAWRRVGLALDRVGFTVEDRDRTKGLYYVRYIDPRTDQKTEDKSWFSSIKFWGSSTEKPKTEQYRIEVKDVTNGGTQVKVLNKDGGQDQSETAGRILALLYDQLK